ncbi:MAG: hypothetical protein ACXU82_18720 [Caulobacteraceae bacterium]
MTPRLLVVCLGGLAGAGALVCCDLDEGIETSEAQPADETADASVDEGEPAEAEPVPVH